MTDVEPFTVTRYRCPFCRRSWQSKKRAEGHAAVCWFNHGCKTCRHADAYAGVWVHDCELGENLCTDPEDPQRPVLRSQCPLWESAS